MKQQIAEAAISQWGNSLAVRLSKSIVSAAGVSDGTHVRVIAEPGRIILEMTEHEMTLDQMLSAFDPKRHGVEAMDFAPIGVEVL